MKSSGQLDQEFGEQAIQMLLDRPFESLCLTAQTAVLEYHRNKGKPPMAVGYSEDLNLQRYC